MAGVEEHRTFFARMITANAGIPPGSELEAAFASIPRERFLPPGPWKVYAPRAGYIETPSDDPVFLYQDVVVSLGTAGPLNNGQPTLHAVSIAALHIERGNRIVHVGAATGYYTAMLAELTGKDGFVDAYGVEPSSAPQASRNLAEYPQVAVHHRSGSEAPLPECDVIYVSAGATEPLRVWRDAPGDTAAGRQIRFPFCRAGDVRSVRRGARRSYRAEANRSFSGIRMDASQVVASRRAFPRRLLVYRRQGGRFQRANN